MNVTRRTSRTRREPCTETHRLQTLLELACVRQIELSCEGDDDELGIAVGTQLENERGHSSRTPETTGRVK